MSGDDATAAGASLAANPAFDYLPPALGDAVLTDAGTVPGFVETVMGEIYLARGQDVHRAKGKRRNRVQVL